MSAGGRYIGSGWRAKVLVVILFGLSVAVLGRLVFNNWATFVEFEWAIRPWWLVTAVVLFAINVLAGSWGWHSLVVGFAGFDDMRQNIKIIWSSNLAHRIPGPVWYIASRAIQYEKLGISKRLISLISAFEITFSLVSVGTLFVITLPFWVQSGVGFDQVDRYWYLLLVFPFSLLAVRPKFLMWVGQWLGGITIFRELDWRNSISWMLLYLFFWALGGLTLYALILTVYPLDISYLFTIISMWALANTISLIGVMILPFIGLRELSIVFLISNVVPLPVAILVSLCIRVIWLSGELITALVSFKL